MAQLKSWLVQVWCPACGDVEWRYPETDQEAGTLVVDLCSRCAGVMRPTGEVNDAVNTGDDARLREG